MTHTMHFLFKSNLVLSYMQILLSLRKKQWCKFCRVLCSAQHSSLPEKQNKTKQIKTKHSVYLLNGIDLNRTTLNKRHFPLGLTEVSVNNWILRLFFFNIRIENISPYFLPFMYHFYFICIFHIIPADSLWSYYTLPQLPLAVCLCNCEMSK